MTQLPALAAAALLLVVAVSGCSKAENAGSSPSPQSDREQVLSEAREQGASPEQLKVLEEAGPSGVGFATYEKAVAKALKCMREAGIKVINDNVTSTEGSPSIEYSYSVDGVGSSQDDGQKIADGCLRRHSQFIEWSYQGSSAVTKARNKYYANSKELRAAIECLKKANVDVPRGATWDDVNRLSAEGIAREADSAKDQSSLAQCMLEA